MWPRRIETLLIVGTILFGCVSIGAQTPRNDMGRGAQRFMEYCAGCHGADGRGGRGGDKAPPVVSDSNLTKPSDAERFRIVHDGTKGGMPPFAQIGDANIRAVLQFLNRLEENTTSGGTSAEVMVTGDVDAGRTLYFGKAECSTCHLMQGKGGFIASNLTGYGRNRTAAEILHAITNPDTPLAPSSQVVTVTTRTGQKLTGPLRNEDGFMLALQTEDGRYHLLSRSDVTDVRYSEHSLMPRDYSTRLSPKELNDIVSFLIVESRSQRPDKEGGR
ncbi:MAG: c-type cytochrome [Candidatus Sulfotelmatobacter sp.]